VSKRLLLVAKKVSVQRSAEPEPSAWFHGAVSEIRDVKSASEVTRELAV
jgi:hypothetical protein